MMGQTSVAKCKALMGSAVKGLVLSVPVFDRHF